MNTVYANTQGKVLLKPCPNLKSGKQYGDSLK